MEGGLHTRSVLKKNIQGAPLISIITVVYNRKTYLDQAILSVLNQTYENIEYIIIDGGSIDGTLDIIKKYDEIVDYWVSEPDNGIYHAINKGIKCSTGELIGILNSDDFFFNDAIYNIVNSYLESDGDIFHGNMCAIKEFDSVSLIKKVAPKFNDLLKRMSINHSTTFIRTSLFKELGLYDTKYKIAADYDLILKLFLAEKKFIYIDRFITNFRLEGVSSTNNCLCDLEIYKIHRNYNLPAISVFLKPFIRCMIKRFFFTVISMLNNRKINELMITGYIRKWNSKPFSENIRVNPFQAIKNLNQIMKNRKFL